MEKPLRLGVAGLGVVGSSLAKLLHRRRAEFVARAGRECAIVAYSARKVRGREAGLGQAAFSKAPPKWRPPRTSTFLSN